MKTLIASLALTTLFSLSASAQSTGMVRVDAKEGSAPYTVYGALLPSIDLYVFGAHGEPEFVAGKIVPVASSGQHALLAGAYGSYKSGSGDWSLIPWVFVKGPALGGTYGVHVAGYAPLNGGSSRLFADDLSLMWGEGRVKAGVAATLSLPQGGSLTAGIGPKVSISAPWGSVTFAVFARNQGSDVLRVSPKIAF